MKKKVLISISVVLLVSLMIVFIGVLCSPFVPYILRAVFFEEPSSPEMAVAIPREMTERAETRAVEANEEVIIPTETPLPTETASPVVTETESPTETPSSEPSTTPTVDPYSIPEGWELTRFSKEHQMIFGGWNLESCLHYDEKDFLTYPESYPVYATPVEGLSVLSVEEKKDLKCVSLDLDLTTENNNVNDFASYVVEFSGQVPINSYYVVFFNVAITNPERYNQYLYWGRGDLDQVLLTEFSEIWKGSSWEGMSAPSLSFVTLVPLTEEKALLLKENGIVSFSFNHVLP